MGGRLSANNITFESATSNSFMHSFIDKATYNVYCNGETIGLVIFIPGRIKLVVGELTSEYRISDIAIEMQSIDRVLDATKPKIVEMYHESRGDLFEDALEFKHRDPANIGNGLHDYDVLYDGNAIGKLLFLITDHMIIHKVNVLYLGQLKQRHHFILKWRQINLKISLPIERF